MNARRSANADIAVIGADAGGLTLALACRLQGLDCHLYVEPGSTGATTAESPEHSPVDPIIELTANATRILQALGLKKALAARSPEPLYSLTRTGRGGLLLSQRPLGAFSTARYGATCYLLAQSELLELLHDACDQADVEIHELAAPLRAIDHSTGTLTFADGTRQQHDIIAIAVPLQAEEDSSRFSSTPTPAEFTVLRADSSQQGNAQAVQIWTSKALCCIEYPRKGGSQLLAIIPGAHDHSPPEQILSDHLATLHPHLRNLANGFERVSRLDGIDELPREHWHHARRVLLGNACHRLPAYATQATAATMEDAWVLSTMLERWEASPTEGLADYQRFRRPRVLKIREHAVAQARALTLAESKAIWRRNFIWGMTSRFLPEHSMSQDDWLFGYDCIKGFV